MSSQRILRLALLLAVLSLLACVPKRHRADPYAALIPDEPVPSAPLPVDPAVRSGVLPNGLTWYVQRNLAPPDRAILRLVVRVGSVVEDEDQLGAAHYVEHMAFNGTEHFPGNELVAYLESIGSGFGAHVNAHTSWDETVYKLEVPTTDAETLDRGILVLSDFARGVTFDPEQFEAERGVVLEEWRLDQGLADRMQDAILPALWHDSRYLDRRPIGTEESLRGLSVEATRRFYDDWYRPDLMAVIAVGEFDEEQVQKSIIAHFGDWTGPEPPRERPWPELPEHPDPIITVFADPELPVTAVEVADKYDQVEESTWGGYRQTLVDWLVLSMVVERLQQRALMPDAPWLEAWPDEQRLTPSRGVRSLMAVVPEGRSLAGVDGLLEELERVQQHGFTEGELGRAQASVMSQMREYYGERETTDSVEHAQEIVRVFTTGEGMPGEEVEYLLAKRWLPEIDLAEVNEAGRGWMDGGGRLIQVYQPAKEGLDVPDPSDLQAVVEAVVARPIAPPADEGEAVPLMAEPPAPGETVDEAYRPDLNLTTWTLANGATVVLKPTRFKADDVRFEATSPGGTSTIEDADFVPGMTATEVAGWSGAGELDLPALLRAMAGKRVGLTYWLERHADRIEGASSTEDLELLLQRIHLVFAGPRFDEGALERERELRRAAIENRSADPEAAFWDLVDERWWQGNFRYQTWTLDQLEQMDLETSERIYRQRFGDPADFTFVFVGNLRPEPFKLLVEQYIGSLPSQGTAEEWVDRGAERLPTLHRETVRMGTAPRATVVLRFHGTFESTWLSRNRLYGMTDVLDIRLREVLREDLGGTYGASVSAQTDDIEGAWEVEVEFQCDPERVDELRDATWAVIDELRTTAVDDRYVDDLKARDLRQREEANYDNSWWAAAITGALQRGEDPGELLTFEERTMSLTTEEVRATAEKMLDPKRYLEMVLLPAEEEAVEEEPEE